MPSRAAPGPDPVARSAPRERRSRLTSPARRSALLPAALALLGAIALFAAPARAQAPPTPTGLTLTAGDGQFTATWNASPGAGTYVIRYAPQGGAWAAVFARPGTATSKTIVSGSAITISNGTTYWARIRACAGTSTGGANCSALSAAATVTPNKPKQPPPTPTGLTLAAGDGQFTATWNASPGAGTYIIQYGVDGAPLQLAVYVRPGTATSRTIASTNIVTISNGTTYRARISACSGTAPLFNLEDCSAYSAGVTVTPNKPKQPPPAVPAVRLAASPATVAEGSPVTVTATLSEALAAEVTIPVTLTAGTAEPGDFGALASIRIPAGSASGAGTVATAHDGDAEDETFTVSLGTLPPSVSAGTPSSVTVTIADGGATGDGDPAAPTVSISASPNPVAEGSAVTVRVTLTAALAEDVTIPVGLFAVTAEPGDFGALASIRIPAGSTVGAAEVATAHDEDAEDETFTVEMALESLPREVRAHARHWVVVTIADSAAGETGAGTDPGDTGPPDTPDTEASATPVVGRRARAIDSPYCFVPDRAELDALGESTHLAYRLDNGRDFDLCLWDADENWKDAPAYASCRGGGGAFPRHASHPEPGAEPAGEPSSEKTLSAERAAGLMACVVPTGGEGGDWLLRVAPDNPAPENPAPENPE